MQEVLSFQPSELLFNFNRAAMRKSIIVPAALTGALVLAIMNHCQKKSVPGESEPVYETLATNQDASGPVITVRFEKGKYHNHPLMAIWIEDTSGNFVQNIYVAESIAKGVFRHADNSRGQWMPGEIRRPAALPYWGHKRGVQADDGLYIPDARNPLPDAVSGPTPQGNFILRSRLADTSLHVFRVMCEINQSWDWNEFWTNNKFPDDKEYKTSSQPAVVYSATIDLTKGTTEAEMRVAGRSHHSGKDGNLYSDLNTLTTALQIARSIRITCTRD